MICIILCAGYATRLYPLTLDVPKPLLEVGGKPILGHILSKVGEIPELSTIYVVTNQKFFPHFSRWAEQNKSGKKIVVINDKTASNEDRLGSLGDIQFAVDTAGIDDDVLVIAGDNLFEFSLKEFTKWSIRKGRTGVVAFDVQEKSLAKLYGIIQVEKDGRMSGFREKPENPISTLASTGIYFYPKHVLPHLKEFVAKFKNTDKAGHFLEYLYKKQEVFCFITKERWFDIGDKEQLQRAREEFKG
ncbi:nucleotidyltransferase family protein [Candidatus Woesearchaeota archaeon]|nr:nucleotidyltransferase family protein [Candidatus Woesearchaeota archaeon]